MKQILIILFRIFMALLWVLYNLIYYKNVNVIKISHDEIGFKLDDSVDVIRTREIKATIKKLPYCWYTVLVNDFHCCGIWVEAMTCSPGRRDDVKM